MEVCCTLNGLLEDNLRKESVEVYEWLGCRYMMDLDSIQKEVK